jgi:hypothetical protein
MAGKPSPHRPSISQLTSQLEPIPSVFPETASRGIPTTSRPAPFRFSIMVILTNIGQTQSQQDLSNMLRNKLNPFEKEHLGAHFRKILIR